LSTPILALSYFFHLLATIVWLGGLVILTLLVWPEARRTLSEAPALYTLLTRMRKRFLPLTNFCLVVLIFTGLIQLTDDPHYDGVLQFTNEWSRVILLKHVAIGGMILCSLALQYYVTPALERATLLVERGKSDGADWTRLRQREIRLTQLSLLLGILVLAFTAWATAIP